MPHFLQRWIGWLSLAGAVLFPLGGRAAAPPARLDPGSNSAVVTVGPLAAPGAVFVLGNASAPGLAQGGGVLFQTNAVSLAEFVCPLPLPGGPGDQGFFLAGYWPGRAVSEFGDAEAGLDPEPDPEATVHFLQAAFGLGPDPVPPEMISALVDALAGIRQAARDPNPAWLCPIQGQSQPRVAGTYGEWRGWTSQGAHRGLDLCAAGGPVVASRGGVISAQGSRNGSGFLVLDHGDGWFSRYDGLDETALPVGPGSLVARGDVLAGRARPGADGLARVHFEIRRGDGSAQWGAPRPGASQDPLQTPGTFAVAASARAPELFEAGLSGVSPGMTPFVKGPPSGATNSTVYVFAQLADREPRCDGGESRLAPRWAAFQAEGLPESRIHPSNESVLVQLESAAGTGPQGFARYGMPHSAIPDPLNWHRYWWAWDTSRHAADPKGPRTLQFTAQGFDGRLSTNSLSFGPLIKNNRIESAGSRQYAATVTAHLGSTAGGNALVQPDQYQLEVLRADGSPMAGVQWANALPGALTPLMTNHLSETVAVFELPEGVVETGMVLRASSRAAPGVRHQAGVSTLTLPCRCSKAPPLVDIPAGVFLMGSPASEPGRFTWEGPQTQVTLTYGFKIGRTEVTQGEYRAIMGVNPSYFSGNSNRPVEQASWEDAVEYCRRLTLCEQQAGCLPATWAYRLPTEAEWEYACRAGTATAFHYGTALRSGMANFDGVYEYDSATGPENNPLGVHLWRTTEVAGYAPNAWGLCDMHGNVWEWCSDWWSATLPGGAQVNPAGPATGTEHSIRGGCWYNDGRFCRAAYRLRAQPKTKSNDIGFRVVLAPLSP